MASYPIKWFSYDMTGIPQLTRTPGELTTLLDAVLVNGFNAKSAATLTRVGTTATMTFATSPGFVKDQIVLVENCDQAEYNGEQRVTTVGANTITFDVAATAVTPATTSSAIACKAAPLGFEIAFTATNRRVYRSKNVASLRPYIRVDNDALSGWVAGHNIGGRVVVGLSMSDIDTFTAEYMPYRSDITSFPAAGWGHWYYAMGAQSGYYASSYPANANNKNFVVVADDRSFYFLLSLTTQTNYASSSVGNTRIIYGAGDFLSYKPNDAFAQWLWCCENYVTAETSSGSSNQSTGMPYSANFDRANRTGRLVTRNYLGFGVHARVGAFTLDTNGTTTFRSGADTGVMWPNYPNFGLLLHPVYLSEDTSTVRGVQPGLYAIHNNAGTAIPDKLVVDNVTGYGNKKFMLLLADTAVDYGSTIWTANSDGRVAFDITGPWSYA